MHGDELLHAVDGAQRRGDAPIAFRRHARILGMAGDAHLVLVGHRHHALEEIIDALPEGVGIDQARLGQRRVLGHRLLVVPLFIDGVAAARHFFQPRHAEQAHILYLMSLMPVAAQVRIWFWKASISRSRCRALAQHDAGILFPVDQRGGEQHAVHHVDLELPLVRRCPASCASLPASDKAGWDRSTTGLVQMASTPKRATQAAVLSVRVPN